jgi:hypothetical protein
MRSRRSSASSVRRARPWVMTGTLTEIRRRTGAGQERTRETYRLAGNRSSQPPSASRALVPQATSAPSQRGPTPWRRLARRRSSHLATWWSVFRPSSAAAGSPPGSTLRRSPTGTSRRPCGSRDAGSTSGSCDPSSDPVVRFQVLRPFRSPSAPSPSCDGSGAGPVSSSRHFDCLERGEDYERPEAGSTPHLRRSGHISAGQRLKTKSDNSPATVAGITARGERAGQAWCRGENTRAGSTSR